MAEVQDVVMRRIADAIERIPETESQAYREALAAVPHLVQQESNPQQFVAFERGNYISAASRLCRYWEQRTLSFGERSFLPLNLSGLGALSVEDINVVGNGFAAVLPRHSSGRNVLLLDRARCDESSSSAAEARALFYQLHQIAKDYLSQTDEFYLLVKVLRELISSGQDDQTGTRNFSRVVNVFPIRITALHLVAVLPLSSSSASLNQILRLNLVWLKQAWEEAVQGVHAQVHMVNDDIIAGQILERQGFSYSGLPSSMGGSWSYQYDYSKWLLAQSSKERFRNFGSPDRFIESAGGATFGAPVPSVQAVPPLIVEGSVDDNPQMRERGLLILDEAIQCLPEGKRSAYLEALQKCPDIVKMESDPIHFLRYEGYDHWAAAHRLTAYWTWRRRIFRERAFLPMTMTGEGALSQEDIVHVRRGYFALLPNDKDGRTVICYDPSRRVFHSKETRMRVGFYFWSLMSENEITRRDGYVGIVLLGTAGFGSSSIDGAIRECVDLVSESFPTRAKNIHLVQCLSTEGRRTLLQMILPLLNYVMGRIMENRAVTHIGDTAEALLDGLAKYGLQENGLPCSAGGTWDYDNFYRWQLDRCQLERNRYRSSGSAGNTSSSRKRSYVPDPVQSDAVTTDLETNIMEALRRLPRRETACAMEAMAKYKLLAHEESNFKRFVNVESGDLVAVANRLAFYWSYRCALFGDKTYLSMAQTGEGALTRSDLTTLSSGYFTILPTHKDDPVIVSIDVSRQERSDPSSLLRLAFYIFQVASENPISQLDGVVVVVTGILQVVKEKANIEFQQIFNALPIKISAIHFVHIYSADDEVTGVSLDGAVSLMRQKFGFAGNEKAMLHVGRSKDELYEQLRPYGIRRDVLPKVIGGSFGFDRFFQWQETRTRYEWGLPSAANDHDTAYDFSHVRALSQLDADERKERKRRMNVVHSRRKRERERIEIQVLREQCADLKDDRGSLMKKHKRLEQLMAQAQAAITEVFAVGPNPQMSMNVETMSKGQPKALLPTPVLRGN
ncbi:hypothetical protein ACA910_021683 [Epithemia clementina (nom. ined.)]